MNDSTANGTRGGRVTAAHAFALRRDSHLPLYLQIKREVLRRIMSWPDGERRFYSDEELCAAFSVSRMTVRQAIKELVDEGYLTRARGLGTFLTTKKLEDRPLSGPLDRLSFEGRPYEIRYLRFGRRKCPGPVCVQLDLPAGTEVLFVRRLRIAAGVPVSLDVRWIPLEFASGLTRKLAQSQSLIRFLGDRYAISEARMQFEGGLASEEEARALKIVEGDPVLLRYMTYHTLEGRVVMAGRSTHRSDVTRYTVNIALQP